MHSTIVHSTQSPVYDVLQSVLVGKLTEHQLESCPRYGEKHNQIVLVASEYLRCVITENMKIPE